MKSFVQEFKQFIARGNVIDLAVGVVIGGAFQKIVSALVADVVFPALSPVLSIASFAEWKVGPVLLGHFIQAIVDFLIVAFFIFLLVKFVNRFKKKEEEKPAMQSQEVQLLSEIRDLLNKQA